LLGTKFTMESDFSSAVEYGQSGLAFTRQELK
jgi:hypothetical protein